MYDLKCYWCGLFLCMGDFVMLINGLLGMGKEFVVWVLVLLCYVFYELKCGGFGWDFVYGFFVLNLVVLLLMLIELEFFGYRCGVFMGVLVDCVGWMEECLLMGVVFFDEIGEMDMGI